MSAVRIARGEYQGYPPGVVRGSARHASMASSVNQTVRLPRCRKLASYSCQFMTLCFCLGMWWRRFWFSLNGKMDIRGQGGASYSGPVPDATGRIHATRWRTPLPALEREPVRKLRRALHAVARYLRSQSAWLVNYAERWRAGLRVGTSLTEAAANFLVNKRMAKSQQMRWSRRGADLLLQVRCAVYNGALGSDFGQLFEPAPGSGLHQAEAA